MRILFLAQRVPFPPNRGDKITTYHEIAHLAREHEVSVACFADGQEDLANVGGLASLTQTIEAVPLAPMAARLRALLALASKTPLTVAYFNDPELHRRVRALARSQRFDAVIVYSSSMAQFVESLTDVPRIMQFADLDSLKWQHYSESLRFPRSWLYRLEARRLLAYERHIATTFDHSLLCTPREVRDFHRLIPDAPVSCVGNGVDLEYFQPMTAVKKKPNSLIFTGVMDYFPNVDAVLWFCQEVFPRLRQQVPDVTFTICGSKPQKEVQALANLPGVIVTGRVPDVRPYLAEARVCVIPLRIARGIQNKLLEAMAMGLPTVATTAAYDGIDAVRDADLLVADEPDLFAAQVARLLLDETLGQKMGQAARAAVEKNYRWEVHLAQLDAVLASLTRKHQAAPEVRVAT